MTVRKSGSAGAPDTAGTEELLRRALAGEAETVGVSPDALGRIRGSVRRRRARRWVWRPGPLRVGAVAATAAAVVAAILAGLGGALPRPGGTRPPNPAGAAHPGRPVPTANLPVYYLGPSGVGGRLYREYHQIPVAGPSAARRIEAALGAMFGLPAADPDYRSPWPGGARVGAVTVDGATASVDLTGAGTGDADPATARMAVQQLVWTATATSVLPGQATGLSGVRLLLDGRPATSLWGTPLPAQPLRRGPAAEVLAPVWVIDPQQGTVQGHSFTVNLAGIVPGATMRLRVLGAAGAVIIDRTVRLSAAAPQVGTASVAIDDLPSGGYTVEGYVAPARGGGEQWPDDHRFTVG
ncbi:hypothetical protein GCM10023322_73190 [Rugosimonospora acidiphila]|uniref:GerMN domain-containing protein n=1 Tax=Rugosimonospora acidiphila TaxID=556531 RepID=A0ABP9SM13_9ACTN